MNIYLLRKEMAGLKLVLWLIVALCGIELCYTLTTGFPDLQTAEERAEAVRTNRPASYGTCCCLDADGHLSFRTRARTQNDAFPGWIAPTAHHLVLSQVCRRLLRAGRLRSSPCNCTQRFLNGWPVILSQPVATCHNCCESLSFLS